MTQPKQIKCRQCGSPTATPQNGLCIICYENGVMLGRVDEEVGS